MALVDKEFSKLGLSYKGVISTVVQAKARTPKYARNCSIHFYAIQIAMKNKNKGLVNDAVPIKCVHVSTLLLF